MKCTFPGPVRRPSDPGVSISRKSTQEGAPVTCASSFQDYDLPRLHAFSIDTSDCCPLFRSSCRGTSYTAPASRHSSQRGWSCKNFLLSRLHRLLYPRAAADRISSECILLCSSQYFCPAGTRFGQPGCLQGTFGLYGMSVTSVPDFSHVKSPGGFILRGFILSSSLTIPYHI